MKSNFATLTPFGSVSCFVVGICLSNYNLNSFLINQAFYSKGYQWYLMHMEVFGSIRKIGRHPIKVSEVLSVLFSCSIYLVVFEICEGLIECKFCIDNYVIIWHSKYKLKLLFKYYRINAKTKLLMNYWSSFILILSTLLTMQGHFQRIDPPFLND